MVRAAVALQARLLLIVVGIVPELALAGAEDVVEGAANDVHERGDEEDNLPLSHRGLRNAKGY